MNKKIAVLGAGSWGTALAILAARNGCRTLLWGHNPEHMAALAQDRENKRYLPGLAFPENLTVTSNLAEVADFCSLILVSVPSHAFKDTLLKLKAYLSSDVQIAWATKGFNPDNGSLLHEVVADIFSAQTPAALLSGPSFASEVAAELPTAITIASSQPDFAGLLADILHSERFRTYTNSDLIGVEVGGAVKTSWR
jgi:glycerol 3-phosphate dehydrogenase (NAD(P)+) (EC 1.1.1.94)